MTRQVLLFGVLAAHVALGNPQTAWAQSGVAVLRATSDQTPVEGEVRFTETAEGLRVEAQIRHAPPGRHGFHIHEFGRCEDAAKAAGNHYNPEGAKHGDLLAEGLQEAHAGDLGNIEIDATGAGRLAKLLPGLRLSEGRFAVAGRAVVLHADPDDFSQPSGNAGARIGCGPIVMTSTAAE